MKPRDPARAVEAMDRIATFLVDAGLGRIDYQVAVYEITQVHDAWVSGEPWYRTLAEAKAQKEAKEAPRTGCASCGANTFEPHRANCSQPAAPRVVEFAPGCECLENPDIDKPAAPTRTEAEDSAEEYDRLMAEQRVLDAMSRVDEMQLQMTADNDEGDDPWAMPAAAELARRRLKEVKDNG